MATKTQQDELCKFAYSGNFEMLRQKIQNNKNLVSLYDNSERLPLHWAVSGGHIELADYLLRQGTPVDARDGFNWTPLMIASSAGRPQIVSNLLSRRAQVNAVNQTGQCSLHYAASKNFFQIVEMLLDEGADVNIGDQMGSTPLHRAASKGHLTSSSCCNMTPSPTDLTQRVTLHSRLANPYHSYQTSLQIDINPSPGETLDLSTLQPSGHLACEEERVEAGKLLVEHGARIDINNKAKKTPLDMAPAGMKRSLKHSLDR